MRFGKTLSDIRSLGSVSGGDIGLYEILDILLDVLLDAGQETNRQLSALPVSAEAAAKWVAVATALNSIPFEAETLAALTGRRRDKLLRLQKELAEKEAGAKRAAKEAEALKKEEDQLTERIEQCGEKAEALRRLQQTVAEMQAEAERLETEIADLGEVDADSVSERRAELQRLKKERSERIRVYNALNDEIKSLLAECGTLNTDVEEAEDRLAAAKRQREEKEQELAHRMAALGQAEKETAERLAAADEEADKIGERITLLQTQYDEKRAEMQRLRAACEELDTQSQQLGEIIDKLIADRKEQERVCSEKQIQTDILKHELEVSREKTAQANKDLQIASDNCKDAEWRIATLKTRKSEFDNEHERLKQERNAVEYSINLKQKDIQECSEMINQKRTELQKKETALAQTKEELNAVEALLSEAENAQSRLRVTIETHRKNLEDTKQRTAAAVTEKAALEAELAVQLELLDEKLEERDESVRQLTEKTALLSSELEEREQEHTALSAEHAAAAARLEQLKTGDGALRESLQALRSEEEDCRHRKETYEKDKALMKQQIAELKSEIEEYERFFNSAECKASELEIERLERLANLYQDGIQSLFGSTAPPVEHLGVLRDSFDAMRRRLKEQINRVQTLMGGLSRDYLELVAKIESEVML